MSEHEHPFPGNVLQTVQTFYTHYEELNGVDETRFFTDDIDSAGVVTSIMRDPDVYWVDKQQTGENADHRPVIDVDFPVYAVESSTPGHSHLYIDRKITWTKYVALLEALAEAGIVEAGYVEAMKRRGFTAVRLPWVTKQDTVRPEDPEKPTCFRCGKTASQFRVYMEQATDAQIPIDRWIRMNEGTFNPKSNHFACDECYIAIGMPSSPEGWKAP